MSAGNRQAYTQPGQQNWLDLYQAAIVEPNKEKLRERVDLARKAIYERICELAEESGMIEERRKIQDALSILRVVLRQGPM